MHHNESIIMIKSANIEMNGRSVSVHGYNYPTVREE